MKRESFTILGSSSGMPQANRATAGYVLTVNGRLTLIDCGGGVCSSFLRCGFDPLHLDRVLISHTHPDHVCELPLFIQMSLLVGRTEKLDIYVPSEFVEPLSSFLPALYLIKERLPFALNVIGYEHGLRFSNDFTLIAVGNNHLRAYADFVERMRLPNRMQCHSFDIEVGGKSLLYSSDIRDLDDVRDHLAGKDYVVIESTHIDLEQFFALAPTLKVGMFVLTHLGSEDEIAAIRQSARKAGVDNLAVAFEGMELSLE
ncbi:MAG TPA: MBL fold metallo-hydrolase [Candidatus Deferrimicrobium sp.]|nr:MBL fold metallo-hydrolase [Candidatus Deferrimicrobium sp.]